MRILLATLKQDHSANRIVEEAKKQGLNVTKRYYTSLDKRALRKHIQQYDFFILRDPYLSGDYSNLVRYVVQRVPKKVLDGRAMKRFPHYEDKWSQAKFFQRLPVPVTKRATQSTTFPAVLKKRICSRGKEVFIVHYKKEISRFLKRRKASDYILQSYLDIEEEYRVLVLNNRVIGTVGKCINRRKKYGLTKLGVTLRKPQRPPRNVLQLALRAVRALQADFVGVDVMKTRDGRVFLIETNLSPQIVAFERETGLNVARELAKFIRKP